MKKIVITGSEGLIGSKLQISLTKNFEVIPLDKSLGHDLTDSSFVKSFFEDNKDIYGLIVLHAYNPKPIKNSLKIEPINFKLNELRDYMEVNVISAFNVISNFIKNNSSGRIINVSSLYGDLSPKHKIYNNFTKHIGYSLSKGSIIVMTKYLATYYTDFNINTVILGGIYQDEFDPKFVKNYNKNVPIGRMMNLDEAISCFEFLLNEKSSYVTGTEIKVDGGWTSW